MPHRLLIEYSFEPTPEFRAYLRPDEVARGEFFALTLSVTNLASDLFPGGTISSLSINFAQQGGDQNVWTPHQLPSCPPVKAGEKQALFSEPAYAMDTGTAWIHLQIQTGDQEPIEYYQSEMGNLPGGEWTNRFYVVNRESLKIISLLDKIATTLG